MFVLYKAGAPKNPAKSLQKNTWARVSSQTLFKRNLAAGAFSINSTKPLRTPPVLNTPYDGF